jgi:hypothetical protein
MQTSSFLGRSQQYTILIFSFKRDLLKKFYNISFSVRQLTAMFYQADFVCKLFSQSNPLTNTKAKNQSVFFE